MSDTIVVADLFYKHASNVTTFYSDLLLSDKVRPVSELIEWVRIQEMNLSVAHNNANEVHLFYKPGVFDYYRAHGRQIRTYADHKQSNLDWTRTSITAAIVDGKFSHTGGHQINAFIPATLKQVEAGYSERSFAVSEPITFGAFIKRWYSGLEDVRQEYADAGYDISMDSILELISLMKLALEQDWSVRKEASIDPSYWPRLVSRCEQLMLSNVPHSVAVASISMSVAMKEYKTDFVFSVEDLEGFNSYPLKMVVDVFKKIAGMNS